MTPLRSGDWVLVADGEKALFLENIGDTQSPNLRLVKKDEQENPPSREQGTDKPGRFKDSGPGQKSSYGGTDFHALAKIDFASELAEDMNRRAERGEFDRIVLVASTEVLGALRPRLSHRVARAVTGEVPKILTNHPVDQLERIVTRELGGA